MEETKTIDVNGLIFLLKFDVKSIEEDFEINDKKIINHRLENAIEKLNQLKQQ